MKKTILIIALCFAFGGTTAIMGQEPDPNTATQNSFERFQKEINQEYNQFKAQANAEFDRFLAEVWTEYQCFKSSGSFYSAPKRSEINTKQTHTGKKYDNEALYNVISIPNTSQVDFFDATQVDEKDMIAFHFYGTPVSFHLSEMLKRKSQGTRESDVAQYYRSMSSRPEVLLLHRELAATIKRLGLNPWGYYLLLRSISEKTFSNNNDRVLFCFLMLHRNGFRARVGRGLESGQLMLLLAIDNSKEVYSLPFYRLNGFKYYAVYGGKRGEDIYSYSEKADAKDLRQIGLNFKYPLHLSSCDKLRKMKLPMAGIDLALPYNTSHLRYYDDMPLTVFPVYAKGGLPTEAYEVIHATIDSLRSRYNTQQIVGILLDFVQTSFAYKIDEEQFGHEKYFFPEEVIGYPYSDCEDRCALFAWLVRSFTDCEVVGVLYGDHLATAVHWDEDFSYPGSCFDYGGKQYVICDPTFPNAPMGSVMPEYTNKRYEVVKIR
jgi:hypothetical protein